MENRPPFSWRNLPSAIRRHDTTWIMLGALIVFAGFFVREELREKNKDLLSSIEGAQIAYNIRQQVAQVADLVNESRDSARPTSNAAGRPKLMQVLAAEADRMADELNSESLSFRLLQALYEKVSDKRPSLTAMNVELGKELEGQAKELGEVWSEQAWSSRAEEDDPVGNLLHLDITLEKTRRAKREVSAS